MNRILSFALCGLVACFSLTALPCRAEEAPPAVSYHREIRSIFQKHCQGCHQPARDSGEYVMTSFDRLLAGGESGMAAIVAGKPEESYLLDLITPIDGQADMPKDKPPLADSEVDLIRRWIEQGAVNDSPAERPAYDAEHPPAYTRPPVITSLDFSPDGKLLAVAGFHEVLLVDTEAGELTARLVGLSERIESVQFSPDGQRLAVTGGSPGRFGEVQIWNVAERRLLLSAPVTYDTIYGGSWSPDGKMIAFGCADNTVRAIDAETGEQVLYQGAHNDWVRDTVFTGGGKHLISVGRDMSCKLTEVATERFVDNITSITPGALKGGVISVARHPSRNEIVIGSSDGVPKVYRVFRLTPRKIGDDANLIRRLPEMPGRVFGVAVSRDGRRLAAVSSLNGTGQARVFSYEFDTSLPEDIKKIVSKRVMEHTEADKKALEAYLTKDVRQISRTDVPQSSLYAVAFHPNGQTFATAGADGVVRMIETESGELVNTISPAPLDQAKLAQAEAAARKVDYIRDVSPLLSRLGCNAGTCHGAAKGKNGFKLSLRGYDPLFDVRALTDDMASRRVNVASPDDSLMLLKPTGAVPHEGGVVLDREHDYYQILTNWIAAGAKLDLSSPRVAKIEVRPDKPTINNIGDSQQMQVVATHENGDTRDVTREAFIESGNTEVAAAEEGGMIRSLRRGEAAILARYEGAYDATTLTVMGPREGFVWQDPPTWGKIDELVAAKWRRMKIQPSELCSDDEFLRRVYLDLTGLPPTAEKARAFLADSRPTQVKRNEVIDELIGSEAFVEYWTNKWADLLQVNRKFLGAEGAATFRKWIRDQVSANTPYNEFAHQVLTAEGSNRENPAVSYYKILRDPLDTMENTTHLFLAVRFNCNKCHDHPFERWTQDQYYETAAFFARTQLKRDPASGSKNIGGTAVEQAKPLYEIVYDAPEGEVEHARTGEAVAPEFPFECDFQASDDATRRERLAAWITSPDNPYFARSYVNRLWGYLFGVGIIQPIDDIRAGNPPTNPELLDYLEQEFIASGFDVRHMLRQICQSRTYQLSVATNPWNEDDQINYSHAIARRLPAEVIFDALHFVTGAKSQIPGVPAGTRAAELPDAGVKLPSEFLANLGRPARESACECERSSDLQLGPVLALVSGPTVGQAIADPNNAIVELAKTTEDDAELVNELFLRILNRPATDDEVAATLKTLQEIDADHQRLVKALADREAYVEKMRPQWEQGRQDAIEQAKAELAAYEKKIAPQRQEQEQKRTELIAQREKELKEYEAKLPEQAAAWEKKQNTEVRWTPLQLENLKASGGVKLIPQADWSVLSTGKAGKSNYTFTARVDLSGVTALRLEALADERLPGGGPGRHNSGNFVLNEFEVQAAPASKPQQKTKVRLVKASADFSQSNFEIAKAVDGSLNGRQGWAVAPAMGVTHWAVFELDQPLSHEGGTILSFTLRQNFNQNDFLLGKFRISVAASDKPVGTSLSQELAATLATPTADRTSEQTEQLTRYYSKIDAELQKRRMALAEAKKPLPPDPKVVDLKNRLARLEKPLPEDSKLARLRKDVEMSQQQRANKRLTIAQDLAWALINHPAFLFNR